MFDGKPCIATDRQTVLSVCQPTSPKGIINAKENKTKNNLEFKVMSLLVILPLNTHKPTRVSAKAGAFDGMHTSNIKNASNNEDTSNRKDTSNNEDAS
jgi:hypothetical protein